MRLLLDTVSLLWLDTNDARLSARARGVLQDPAHDLFLSSASVAEICIKHQLGKLTLHTHPRGLIEQCRSGYGLLPLPFEDEAALLLADLPRVHRDPFDRMLVCQALHGGLTILTPDLQIARYEVPTLW